MMNTVKLSRKFQVVIPKKAREDLQLAAGQELPIYVLEGSIRIPPLRSIKELRGAAKGMNWKDRYRDHSERF
jgi:AbrB family looped-hinge helix DNA binding protein